MTNGLQIKSKKPQNVRPLATVVPHTRVLAQMQCGPLTARTFHHHRQTEIGETPIVAYDHRRHLPLLHQRNIVLRRRQPP
jgi:hypothetical protein